MVGSKIRKAWNDIKSLRNNSKNSGIYIIGIDKFKLYFDGILKGD